MSAPRKPATSFDPAAPADGDLEIRAILPVRAAEPSHSHVAPGADETGEFSREEPFKGIYATRDGVKFREQTAIERSKDRRKLFFTVILVLLLVLGAGGYLAFRFSPAAQKWAHRQITTLKQAKLPKQMTVLLSLPLQKLEQKFSNRLAPGSSQSASKPWSEMSCKFLIQEALTRKLKQGLDAEGAYLLLGCHLSNDLPEMALRTHREIDTAHSGDPSWAAAPELLIVAEARVRMRALQVQSLPRSTDCPKWQAKPACLLRYVAQARQPLQSKQDGAYQLLDQALRQQSPRLRVWLNWAAGLHAMKEGRGGEGEGRLEAAAMLLKKNHDPFLEREVFRSRVRNAWTLRDEKLMAKVWTQRPQRRMSEDSLGYLDVELMHRTLLNLKPPGVALEEFLNHPESYQRFRFDPYFVQLVVAQGITVQKIAQASGYLDHIAQAEEEAQSVRQNEWMDLLRVRILLAQGQGLEAMKKIQALERYVPQSPLVIHLKGLALLHGFTSKPYRMKAAQEFQKAINSGARAPSYFAMIVAFLEAEQNLKAEATLSYWQKNPVQGSDRLWVGFARGLIRHRNGEEAEALKMWEDLAMQFPDMSFIRSFEQSLRKQPKALENQVFNFLIRSLPPTGPLGPLVELSQKS